MPTKKSLRQSVSLPPQTARRIKALALRHKSSANRVIVDLIETGLEAVDNERQRFLELADRLAAVSDPTERRRLKEELARMTFGE